MPTGMNGRMVERLRQYCERFAPLGQLDDAQLAMLALHMPALLDRAAELEKMRCVLLDVLDKPDLCNGGRG